MGQNMNTPSLHGRQIRSGLHKHEQLLQNYGLHLQGHMPQLTHQVLLHTLLLLPLLPVLWNNQQLNRH